MSKPRILFAEGITSRNTPSPGVEAPRPAY